MKTEVLVLMSTYNGEKYIDEQIESIKNQNFDGNITIQIRDDGSWDGTIDRLKKIKQQCNRTILVDCGENVGPQKSFLKQIKNANRADFYFFADQDDIWSQDKIRIAVEKMSIVNEKPVCYCSNYSLFNQKLGTERNQVLVEKPIFHPLKIIFYNQIPGCTMGFDYELMKLLKRLDLSDAMMHDSMSLALCAACGTVIYDNNSMIRHRIHGNNVVGEGHKKIVLKKWIIEKMKLLINKETYDLSEMARRFIEIGNIKSQYINDLYTLRDYKKRWSNTRKLLNHPDSHDIFMDRTTLSIRCKILFHLF